MTRRLSEERDVLTHNSVDGTEKDRRLQRWMEKRVTARDDTTPTVTVNHPTDRTPIDSASQVNLTPFHILLFYFHHCSLLFITNWIFS